MLTRKELYNIPGWRTKRHLVVFESDDWGSIRMPSIEIYESFLRKGIRVDKDPYCKYDNLATKKDLSDLFEVLDSVRDINGNPAVITANAVVANPVFDKIRESEFKEYYYEPFTETLKRYSQCEGALDSWQEGMKRGLFHPQFHGREHLNVKSWLRVLQQGPSVTMTAFELGTFGLTYLVDPSIKLYYMGAFNSCLDEDVRKYNVILQDGLDMFEKLFGFRSKSFIATTYEWSPKIEPCLVKNGVEYIQGAVAQKIPLDDDCTFKVKRNGFQGTKTKSGLVRLMRNCFFEPSISPGYDYVNDCLHRMEIAFRWGKAANICTHRLNFIGSIHKSNTDKNLPELSRLLKEMLKRWPDIEFVTSDQLGKIIVDSDK